MAKVSNHQIAEALLQLSPKLSQERLAESLAAYLNQQRRSADLSSIMRLYEKLRYDANGILELDVTSAHPLSSDIVKQIEQLVEATQVIINQVTDRAVIGGVRIESNQYYLDLTVRSRLDRFKVSKTGAYQE